MKSFSTILLLSLLTLCACSPEAKKARYLESAAEYYDAGRMEEAWIAYRNVLSMDDNNPVALERMGLIAFDRGELQAAFPLLGRFKMLEPDNVGAREKLSFIYRVAGEPDKARTEAMEILDMDPINESAMLMLADTVTGSLLVRETFDRLEQLPEGAESTVAFHRALANLHIRLQEFDEARAELNRAVEIDPASAGAYLDLAGLAVVQGDLEGADTFFGKAAGLSPAKSMSHLKWAEFKTRTGRLEEAKSILNAVTEEAPDFVSAWVYLARIAFAEKDYDHCHEMVDRVLKSAPRNVQALVLDAQLDLANDDLETGLEKLNRLAETFTGVPLVHYQLALARLRNADRPAAMASLDRVVRLNPNFEDAVVLLAGLKMEAGDMTGAVSDLEEIVRRRPGIVRARQLLVQGWLRVGRFQETVDLVDALLAQQPDNTALLQSKGVALAELDRNDEARAVFDRILDLTSDDSGPRADPIRENALARLLDMDVKEGGPDAALTRANAFIAADPGSAAARYFRSRLHKMREDDDAMEADLVKAIELDPGLVSAYFDLARLYADSERSDEALEELEKALAENPDHIPSLTLSGMLHEARGDFPTAAKRYERLIALLPDSPLGLNNLSYIYAEKLDRLDDAFELATRARRSAVDKGNAASGAAGPGLKDAFASYTADTLGWILFRRGDYRRASALIRESIDRLGGNAEVQYHRGMTGYMMGDVEDAKTAFRKALEIDPNLTRKESALERLQVLSLAGEPSDEVLAGRLKARLEQDPRDVVALIMLGEAHRRAGRFDDAASAFNRALAVNGESVHTLIPLAALEAGHFADAARALTLLRRAQELADGDPASMREIGVIAFRCGDAVWSNRVLGELAERGTLDDEARFCLGRSEIRMGDLRRADEIMADISRRSDAGGWATQAGEFHRMIDACRNRRIDAGTMALAAKVLESDPGEETALLITALAAERDGEHEKASGICEAIIKANPDFAPAAKHQAELLAGPLNDPEAAFRLALNARRQLPDDVELTRLFGRLLYERGDSEWAVRIFKELTGDAEGTADDYCYLGMALKETGQPVEAKAALERGLELKPATGLAAKAREALKEM